MLYREGHVPRELEGRGTWMKHPIGDNKFELLFSPFNGNYLEKRKCIVCGAIYYKRDKFNCLKCGSSPDFNMKNIKE